LVWGGNRRECVEYRGRARKREVLRTEKAEVQRGEDFQMVLPPTGRRESFLAAVGSNRKGESKTQGLKGRTDHKKLAPPFSPRLKKGGNCKGSLDHS